MTGVISPVKIARRASSGKDQRFSIGIRIKIQQFSVGRFGSMVRRTMGREFGKLKLLFSGMVVLARGQKILGSGLEGLMTRSVRHVSGYQLTNDATQET